MAHKPGKKINRKRLWYSITPLLLMLAAIVAINLITASRAAEPENETAAATAVPTQAVTFAVMPARPPILQATILPSPTPTITPLPELPDTATIALFGPPDESSLVLNGRVTFYWTYSEPLLPGQVFTLTLRQNETVLASSSLSQPNFGTGYQVSLNMAEVAEVGTAEWQVQLQWQDSTQPLLTSNSRSITLLPEG